MFERFGSGNERLSLPYGLIACLAWGVLAPSSATAACGSYVTPRTTAGSTERLTIALARTDVGFLPSAPLRRSPCPLCSRKPAEPPPLPAAVPAPSFESWPFLTTADANPSLGGGWFNSERDRSRPIHRPFLILHPPRPAR